MASARSILENKGYKLFFVPPDDTVSVALMKLTERKVGAVLVMDGEKLLGIFTERDLARNLAERGSAVLHAPVSEAMTTPVYGVDLDTSIDQCMSVMSEKGIRHLPVTDKGLVMGVISIRDVVKALIQDREAEIHALENYIVVGQYPT